MSACLWVWVLVLVCVYVWSMFWTLSYLVVSFDRKPRWKSWALGAYMFFFFFLPMWGSFNTPNHRVAAGAQNKAPLL